MKVPLGGGNPVVLANKPASGPWGIAVDATSVHWTNSASSVNGNQVMRAPLGGGGNPVTIATSQEPLGIAVDAAYVYWNSGIGGQVLKAPLGGAPPSSSPSTSRGR